MKTTRHPPAAPTSPTHEFLVLCARPEFPAAPLPAPREAPPPPRPLADCDGMFWRPGHRDDHAA